MTVQDILAEIEKLGRLAVKLSGGVTGLMRDLRAFEEEIGQLERAVAELARQKAWEERAK